MPTMKRLWPLALAPLCGACVTLNEPVLTPDAVGKGQRAIVLVYPAPGPWVITDSESKAESAAKMLPGISFAVQSFQDDRYKAASNTLQKYVPRWPLQGLLEEELLKSLPRARFPGRFVPVAEAEADTATLRGWNRAADTLDWQGRYLYPDPTAPHPRDYSRFLPWDDALAFEVNVLPQLSADDEGNMIPTLIAVTRVLRCQTMHLLWRHEDKVDAPANARTLYEFETLPMQLIDRWKALVKPLADKVADSLYTALHPGSAPGSLPPAGPVPVQPPALSTAAVSGIPPAVSTSTQAASAPVAVSTQAVSISTAPASP